MGNRLQDTQPNEILRKHPNTTHYHKQKYTAVYPSDIHMRVQTVPHTTINKNIPGTAVYRFDIHMRVQTVVIFPARVVCTAINSTEQYLGVCDLPNSVGQPKPRKNRLKSGIWATFSHSKKSFRGLGLILCTKQATRNLTQPNCP